MYNPFKAVHKKLEDQMFDEVQIVMIHALIWIPCYLVAWGLIGLLGPYIIMATFALLAVPLFWAIILYYLFDKKKKYFYIGVASFIVIFFISSGIPGLTKGLFFEFLTMESELYFKLIEIWWAIFNAINPFADNEYPREFYNFSFSTWRIVFLLGGVVVVPLMVLKFLDMDKQEKIDAQNQEKKKIEEEKAKKEKELLDKIRQEEMETLEKQREESKMKAREEKERQRKESTNPDPWNSGFF